jgi:hypothetical protein
MPFAPLGALPMAKVKTKQTTASFLKGAALRESSVFAPHQKALGPRPAAKDDGGIAIVVTPWLALWRGRARLRTRIRAPRLSRHPCRESLRQSANQGAFVTPQAVFFGYFFRASDQREQQPQAGP